MKALKLSLTVLGTGCLMLALMALNQPASGGRIITAGAKVGNDPGHIREGKDLKPLPGDQLASFSGGCFWGTEDLYRHVPGVVATAVGYTGGTVANPSYEQVCSHETGHAETVLVEFNPAKVTYKQLLDTFWQYVDPTAVDRQGPDFGNNYRSAIWTFDADQLKEAKESKAKQQRSETAPIVTPIQPAQKFYLAEEYHQQYDEKTGRASCPAPRTFQGQ
ncbi:MAG TPA: peptide-methionine (S)-S-oxide reductase MsrA [Fimbriimonas sp.]|nr:peptide-methionine (S)-S-oxide reductase MsrA [Fimbriimonas sp.]